MQALVKSVATRPHVPLGVKAPIIRRLLGLWRAQPTQITRD